MTAQPATQATSTPPSGSPGPMAEPAPAHTDVAGAAQGAGAGAAAADFPADFGELATQVDQLRERVEHQPAEIRALLSQTVAAITEFNRRGLVEVVQLLRADPRGEELLFEAVDRPEVMALLVSHGIVRTDRTLDVLRVVEAIRPYLVTSSIQMEVDRVEGDTAYVRFASGCSAPSAQEREEIMGVIRQRVPGLAAVVEVAADPGPAFVPLTSLRIGP